MRVRVREGVRARGGEHVDVRGAGNASRLVVLEIFEAERPPGRLGHSPFCRLRHCLPLQASMHVIGFKGRSMAPRVDPWGHNTAT